MPKRHPPEPRLRDAGDVLLSLSVIIGVMSLIYGALNPDGRWTLADGFLVLAGIACVGAAVISFWTRGEAPESHVADRTSAAAEGPVAPIPQSADSRAPKPSEVTLETVLEHVPTSFVLLDRERRIVTTSSNFEKITGRSADELVGRHCTAHLWSDEVCRGCPSELALRSGQTETEVVEVKGADEGESRFFEHVSIPILNDGAVDGVLEMVTDITDRKVLQDSLVRAEKLAAVGEMASVIAHEMRNALTSVKLILQLLSESKEASVDQESVQVALDSVRRSESIMGQLLRFASPVPLQRSVVNVKALLQEAAGLVGTHFERRNLTLQIVPPSSQLTLWADAEQLKTALLNLLLNAAQAVGQDGSISLRADTGRLARAMRDLEPVKGTSRGHQLEPVEPRSDGSNSSGEIYLRSGRAVVTFEVQDDGAGIPDERLHRIFDPFFTTKLNGTGLGLPLVKRIANDHGGVVRARNLDRGCMFTVTLPLKPNTPSP